MAKQPWIQSSYMSQAEQTRLFDKAGIAKAKETVMDNGWGELEAWYPEEWRTQDWTLRYYDEDTEIAPDGSLWTYTTGQEGDVCICCRATLADHADIFMNTDYPRYRLLCRKCAGCAICHDKLSLPTHPRLPRHKR